MKSLKFYFKKAQKEKWTIGQFNFSTVEQMKAVFMAAKKMKSPAILGTSEGEAGFFGFKQAVALKEIFNLDFKMPLFLNLDHGKDLKIIKGAVDLGYDAVHYDGSGLSLEENIKKTKEVVVYARKRGTLVEGELGLIKGQSVDAKGTPSVSEKELTSPEEVEMFVKETGVDSLAVSIGNMHGVYSKMPELDIKRLSEIREKTEVFLVLHGSSGLQKKDLKKATEKGIVKANINTEFRRAWKEALLEELSSNEMKPYNILSKVEEKLEKKVSLKMAALCSDNKI